jgi:hypothetical protein
MGEFEGFEKLSKDSTEYRLLSGVCKEFEKQESGSISQRSGNATTEVIHDYLVEAGLKLPIEPKVRVHEVRTKMNLLYLLKPDASRKDTIFRASDITFVLKIVNNAVGEDNQNRIKDIFNQFKVRNANIRFAVIVLSEAPSYKYALMQKNFGTTRVFTLALRGKSAKLLYQAPTIKKLQEAGELIKPKNNGLLDLLQFLKKGSEF